MNAPVLPKVGMKVDEFLAWSARQPDDRYELVNGEVVAMTRDTVRHNRTKAAAWRALDDAVRGAIGTLGIDPACLFKMALPIIDDLIGSKLLYKIDVRPGRRGNHIRSLRFCKLNREESHRPRSSVYKDSFALL